jgi:hypothetical protein
MGCFQLAINELTVLELYQSFPRNIRPMQYPLLFLFVLYFHSATPPRPPPWQRNVHTVQSGTRCVLLVPTCSQSLTPQLGVADYNGFGKQSVIGPHNCRLPCRATHSCVRTVNTSISAPQHICLGSNPYKTVHNGLLISFLGAT